MSRAAGERVLLPRVRDAGPDTVVLADGFSCRTQIEQGDTGRTAVHLAELLASGLNDAARGRRTRPAHGPTASIEHEPTTTSRPVMRTVPDLGIELRQRSTREHHRRRLRPAAGCVSGASTTSSATPATASTACSPPGRRADDQPRFVQARHEEMAAFEACGYAKFSGRVGVCTATSGPGAIHLLNGLYDAKLDHVAGGRDRRPDRPVARWAAPTSRRSTCSACTRTSPDEYCQMVTVPEQLPNVLDRAHADRRQPSAP